jgi:hypothetical protein
MFVDADLSTFALGEDWCRILSVTVTQDPVPILVTGLHTVHRLVLSNPDLILSVTDAFRATQERRLTVTHEGDRPALEAIADDLRRNQNPR